MKKIAVITSSFGLTMKLSNPIKRFDTCDYICFSNDIIPDDHNSDWVIKKGPEFSLDPSFSNRRNAKIYKILPNLFLPDYEYYIWLDPTHELIVDPVALIEQYLNDFDIAVFRHNERHCIYDEAKVIKKLKIEYSDIIKRQVRYYKSLSYPRHNGLYELPCRIQRNNAETHRMGLCWWEQICQFSSRDQVSFPFVINQLGIPVNILPGFVNILEGNKLMVVREPSHHKRTVA